MQKKIFISLILLITAASFTYYNLFYSISDNFRTEVPKSVNSSGSTTLSYVPKFTEIESDFDHKHVPGGHVIAGGTLIDVNNDGVEEVFIGGGEGQEDALMYFENGAFVNRISGTNLSDKSATYGAYAIDFNNDSYSDLFVGRNNGLSYYENLKNGKFQIKNLNISFPADTVPLSIAGGDINNDGFLDLYISAFIDSKKMRTAIFNDKSHAKTNVLLLNDGKNNFQDITKVSGAEFSQNTFISSLIDLNSDGFQDIVVSPNTEKVTIFKNNGNLTFTRLPALSEYGFWMGLTTADVDNDGDQDIFVSNSGNSIPASLSRGDLRDSQILDTQWRIYRNDGDFKFTDITKESKLLDYGFAWGTVYYDFNLDLVQDLFVLENYIKWPPHKLKKLSGKFLIGNTENNLLTYSPATKQSGLDNFYYGMAPLVSDWNKDGFPDMFIVNLAGPSRGFLNESKDNKSIILKFKNDIKSIGASVMITLSGGKKIYRYNNTSQGLLSSQGNIQVVGIGGNDSVEKIEVKFLNGETKTYENVKAFGVVEIK